VLGLQGKLPEALDACRQSLVIAKRLAEQDKSNAVCQRVLSGGYIELGDVLVAQGKLPEALDAYRCSLEIRQTLAEQEKSNSGRQRDLIVSLCKVGTTAVKIGGNDMVTQGRGLLQTALRLAQQRYLGSDQRQLIDGLNTALGEIPH
jgi:hypothetical protein